MQEEIRRYYQAFKAEGILGLVSRMTLVLIVLYYSNRWTYAPVVILAVCGLLYSPLSRSTVFWLGITGFLVSLHIFDWYSIDNHDYLIAYWMLALWCAFSLTDDQQRERLLYYNGKYLIGLCMGFAVLWKLISPDYLDGTFFEFTLQGDKRFEDVAHLFGGTSKEVLWGNQKLISILINGYMEGQLVDWVHFGHAAEIKRLSAFLTWWTIGIEALLALVFLFPDRPFLVKYRHVLLLTFALTTYSVATVPGFGWILMILGVAQCRKGQHLFRLLYVGMFLLIIIYTTPLFELLHHVADLVV